MASREQSSESPPFRTAPPQLRIHHLLLCTVVAAIELTVWHNHNSVPSSVVKQFPPLAIALNTVELVLGSIGLTLGLLSVYWHVKGYAGLVQPGQWLLFGYAVEVIPSYLIVLLVHFGFDWGGTLRGEAGITLWLVANVLSLAIFYVVPLVFLAFCAWRVADTLPWRFLFAFLAFTKLITTSSAYHFLLHYLNVPIMAAANAPVLAYSSVTLGLAGWSAMIDWGSQRPRFWPHWAGLGLSIITQSLRVGGGVFWLFS